MMFPYTQHIDFFKMLFWFLFLQPPVGAPNSQAMMQSMDPTRQPGKNNPELGQDYPRTMVKISY